MLQPTSRTVVPPSACDLQAAADAFGLQIWVLTSFESADFLEIEPRQLRSSRVLLLSFFAEVGRSHTWHTVKLQACTSLV